MTNVNINLTKKEEALAKEIFAKKGQTFEEGIEKLILSLVSKDNPKSELPTMVTPKNKPIKMINNGDGTFSYPEGIPEHVKEFHRLG